MKTWFKEYWREQNSYIITPMQALSAILIWMLVSGLTGYMVGSWQPQNGPNDAEIRRLNATIEAWNEMHSLFKGEIISAYEERENDN